MATSKGTSGDQGTRKVHVAMPRRLLERLDGKVDREAGETLSDVVRRACAEFVRR